MPQVKAGYKKQRAGEEGAAAAVQLPVLPQQEGEAAELLGLQLGIPCNGVYVMCVYVSACLFACVCVCICACM